MVIVQPKDFRHYKDCQLRDFLDKTGFRAWLYEVHSYFEWLDILILSFLFREAHVQILVWEDMKDDNLCNI